MKENSKVSRAINRARWAQFRSSNWHCFVPNYTYINVGECRGCSYHSEISNEDEVEPRCKNCASFICNKMGRKNG